MAKTAVISARIDPELKQKAEQIFRELGLTASQAIVLFYRQVDLQRGLPFSIRIPNAVTRQALEDARLRRDLESFDSVEALFEDLENWDAGGIRLVSYIAPLLGSKLGLGRIYDVTDAAVTA